MLTLDYRPARFADLVGQIPARVILQSLVNASKAKPSDLPAAFILRGASGTGKTSAARILAASLNCPSAVNGDCCSECTSCRTIRNGRSDAVHEIDAASHGGVDDIRSLRELVQYAADQPWRVVILDEVHSMSRQAFNALLKVLEEPPARTVFALLTTEPEKIPRTIQSRALPIDFSPVSLDAVLQRLVAIRDAEQLQVSDAILSEIAELSDGGLRGAIVMLDAVRLVRVSEVSQLHRMLGISNSPELILESVLKGDLDSAHEGLTGYFRQSANISDLVSGLIRGLHQRYAVRQVTAAQLFEAVRLLWGARSLSPTSDRNSRAQAEALVTVLFALLSPAVADTSGREVQAI